MNSSLQLSCDNLIADNTSVLQHITKKEIIEGRDLYLECLNHNNYNDLIRERIVGPLIKKYKIDSENDIHIKIKLIPKNNAHHGYDKVITTNIFTVGRSMNCDIVIRDIDISRIHLFGLVINNNILIIDTWSLFGTNIYDNKVIYSNSINNRHIIKFNKDKRCILELNNYLIVLNSDKIINNQYCIICTTTPRIIRNTCGHGVLCQDCNNKLKQYNSYPKCPICNDFIKNEHISNCINTYQSYTI